MTVTKRKPVPARRTRRPRSDATVVEGAATRRYIESSALVAAVLEGDKAATTSIRAEGQRVTSAITVAEASRAVLRARLSGRITAQQERAAILALQRFARRCHIVSVTEAILAQAGRRFPVEPIHPLW